MAEKAQGPGNVEKRYGRCVLCGDRVKGSHDFITTADGYCHRKCLA